MAWLAMHQCVTGALLRLYCLLQGCVPLIAAPVAAPC